MSKFIEFYSGDQGEPRAMGHPIHNGELPTRFFDARGVRVDGEVVEFTDSDTVGNLHRALVETQVLQAAGATVDCFVFAALMDPAHPEPTIAHRVFNYGLEVVTVDVVALAVTGQVSIGVDTGNGDQYFNHSVRTAPIVSGMRVLHKLGYGGQVCLSPLPSAVQMYDHEINSPRTVYAVTTARSVLSAQ